MPTKGNLPLVFHLGQKCFVQMPLSLGTEMSVSQEGTGKKKEGLIRDINKTLKRLCLLCLFIEVFKNKACNLTVPCY